MNKFKNIIFDLGDVLIKLNFLHWMKIMQYKNPAISSDIYEQHYNQYNLPFSTGLVSEKEFEDAYRKYLNDPAMPLTEIKEIHNALFIDDYTLSAPLLEPLAEKYSLYVLSNTDPWHIEYLAETIPGFKTTFTQKVYSYETKSLKPDIEIYNSFLEQTGIDFSETIYFDDFAPNIEMGKQLGLQSILVTGEDELYKFITDNLLLN